MKTKISLLALMMLMPLAGCSGKIIGPGDGGGVANWEGMAPVIQSRTRLVAAFAFSMKQIQPHKVAVCDATQKISEFLNTYDDRDASLEKLQAAVMQFLNTLDPSIRGPVKIIVDMVLTEAFNYTWQYYEGLINQDQAKVALIIAGAVADGLQDACGMTMSTMGVHSDPTPSIFTISWNSRIDHLFAQGNESLAYARKTDSEAESEAKASAAFNCFIEITLNDDSTSDEQERARKLRDDAEQLLRDIQRRQRQVD